MKVSTRTSKRYTWSATIFTILGLAACGGGGDDSQQSSDAATYSSPLSASGEESYNVSGLRLIPDKFLESEPEQLPGHDNNSSTNEDPTESNEVSKRTILSAVVIKSDKSMNGLASQTSPTISAEDIAAADVAMEKGFDSVAKYSIGQLGTDLGPGGLAITNRALTSAHKVPLIGIASTGIPKLDVLYVRAGSISVKQLLNSAVFKQAVAKNTPIIIEREAVGRIAYENLLINVFGFAPKSTNALLMRSDGEKNQSWEAFPLDDDAPDANSSATTPTSQAQYTINLEALASILRGKQILDAASASTKSLIDEMEVQAAVSAAGTAKPIVWGKYVVGQGVNAGDLFPWADDSWILNPKRNYSWEIKGSVCSDALPCGSYGSSVKSITASNTKLDNVVWWDVWNICGEAGSTGSGFCETSYKKSIKMIKGKQYQDAGEVGVTITAGGEGGIPFIAKAKFETAVTVKGTITRTWHSSQETTFEATNNVRVKEGNMVRFGTGDWSIVVTKQLFGRHERREKIGPVKFMWPQEWSMHHSGYCNNMPILDKSSWKNNRYNYMWKLPPKGSYFERHVFNTWCPSYWNGNYRSKPSKQTMKLFGVKKWVICKQVDLACIRKYNSKDMKSLEGVFPL